jgi:hypothetical protein
MATLPTGAIMQLLPDVPPHSIWYVYCIVLFVVFLVLYLTWVLNRRKHKLRRKHNPLPGTVAHEPDLRLPKP